VHAPQTGGGRQGSAAVRSLGVLGGTFNPPHVGHLAVARQALRELALERVLLVPAHTAPNKAQAEGGQEGMSDPGPMHRLRMCELALAGEPHISACALEVERGGVSYTVDTLMSLHASHPNAELTFIVGADAASTLGSWRDPAQLLALAQLAVAARTGAARQRVLDAVAQAAAADGGGERDVRAPTKTVRFLDMPTVEVSSSLVRERVATGEPIDGLVTPAVARYISEHALYRGAAG
jgi:nicotinate-nucleotide adenylyltransferase